MSFFDNYYESENKINIKRIIIENKIVRKTLRV